MNFILLLLLLENCHMPNHCNPIMPAAVASHATHAGWVAQQISLVCASSLTCWGAVVAALLV